MSRKKKFSKKGLRMMLGVMMAFLVVTTVVVAIKASVSGVELAALEKEEMDIEQVNRELASRVVSETSLREMDLKADKLGFSKPEETVYLKLESAVASLHGN